MFKRILVANRGEIAVRVIHTCREMGVESVAVYSDVDEKALHVLEADRAEYLGASEPRESYLHMERIIAAAKKTGCEAVHPGYGFLAENGDFAEACERAGLVFIGPPAQVIRDLGDKIKSREIMIAGGVPVTPGYAGDMSDLETLAGVAGEIGYPVLVKASGGGGGKGIRIVDREDQLEEALASASREAGNAFGDSRIYIEKYFTTSRHIEFQVLGDSHGNMVHLLERECSVQRRHQKIIEETPSNVLSPELRERMGQAAVDAARASGYVNAGTVEFLLDSSGNFYFLEINTRLQVEHPVTEMTTGIDIVRKQLEIAWGMPVGLVQEDIRSTGHSIECRIYAEDPENGFAPSPGRITVLKEPGGPGVRNDCGVYEGFTVPVDYDPILSKLVVLGATREQAMARMIKALKASVVMGVKTPLPMLIDIISSPAFREGEVYTDFMDTHFSDWERKTGDDDLAVIAYLVAGTTASRAENENLQESAAPVSPWHTLGNWDMIH